MIPIFPLVSVDRAKAHLRVPCENDSEVKDKLLLASFIVMNHMKLTAIPDDWIANDESPLPELPASGSVNPVKNTKDISIIETYDSPAILIRVPGNVQSAVLLVLGELFENHESSTSNPISPAVENLLSQFRDPTFS